MKNNNYINATDLGKIASLNSVLETFESKSSNVVYEEEFKEVKRIIKYWETRAHKLINKDNTEAFFFKSQVETQK